MADLKISELTSLPGSSLANTDVLAVVDTSASETKKITSKELVQYGYGLVDPSTLDGNVIEPGTTSARGTVQLTDSTGSTSTTTAATPNAVKSAYDLADAALPKAGGTMTGALGITAGTAAAPSAFFSGDTNTGIYSPGADQVAISTGGEGRLFVASDGKVGIGTSAPGAPLHVAGDSVLGDDGSKGRLTVENTTSAVRLLATTTGFGAYEDLAFTADKYVFNIAAAECARIDSSGRLLVGTSTSSAAAKLVVQGIVSDGNALGLAQLQLGTTSPADGTTLGRLDFSDSAGTQSAWIFSARDGGTWTSGSSSPGRLVFSTTADGASTPTERMRIKSTGAIRYVTAFTVATLPAGEVGDLARVTDATAPAVGATVAGGGAANALCWYNGTNWTVMGV